MHPDDIPNPTNEQLKALNRQVRFVPTDNDTPKVLTPDQVKRYNELGFRVGFQKQ